MTEDKVKDESEESVEIRVWAKKGNMMVRTECLEHDDPAHPYNQILSQGKSPEDYGVYHPDHERFKHHSREQLIRELVQLEKEFESYLRHHQC